MPLTLGLRKGDDFYVANQRVVVTDILGDMHFRLRVKDRVFDVTDARATEILRDVFVSAGEPRAVGTVRIAIDAPRKYLILRGDMYREQGLDKR